MKLIVDTEDRLLTLERGGIYEDIPLYTDRAFELLSREWVRVGWAVGHYHTFNWFGRPVLQLPEDLVRLQEAFYMVQPDVIVETGVYQGGSLLFHAGLCRALGKGRVIGIDKTISEATGSALRNHTLADLISVFEGDSVAPSTVDKVRDSIRAGESVMVILDSHHSAEHVRNELECYAPMVTPGSCIIAADGIMRDLADVPGGEANWVRDNPARAAREFALAHPEFEVRGPITDIQMSPPKGSLTYWPEGWLWKTGQLPSKGLQ